MNKPKGIVYKVRYVIEMEISEEYYSDMAGNQFVGSFPKITAYPPEIIVRDLESDFCRNAAKRCSYIEKHFPDEAKYVCAQMHDLEQLMLSGYPQPVKQNARKRVIEDIKRLTDTRTRKRLATPRGRKPDKSKKDYLADKEKFVNKSVEMLRTLKNEGVAAPTLTDLAEKMFETYIDRNNEEQYYSYPLKELGKKLDLYKISFEDLAMKLTNNVT